MNRSVTLLVALGVVAVTAVWYLLFFSGANQEIADATAELEQARDEQLRLETKLKQLQRIQENQLLYVEALGAVEAGVPPTPQEAALLDDLATLEQESGVVLAGLTLSVPQDVEGADYRVIPMSAVIEGQYFEVLGFVYGLEDLARIIVVRSVSISSAQSEESFTILRVTIGAEAYTTSSLSPPPAGTDSAPEGEDAATTTTEPGGDE